MAGGGKRKSDGAKPSLSLLWKVNRKRGKLSLRGAEQPPGAYRWMRPEPSPPASFSTSATVTML